MLRSTNAWFRTGHSQRLWPAFLVLMVAVALPTAGVLWFMNEAMQNEHLAVLHRLTEVYRAQLQATADRIQAYWREKESAIIQTGEQKTAGEAFAELVNGNNADSVLIYDSEGKLIYPDFAVTPRLQAEPETEMWREARRFEYERNLPAEAAKVYLEIAQKARDASESSPALLARARCLNKAGERQAAIDALVSEFGVGHYRTVVDGQGRLAAPSALLMAFELMQDPSAPIYRETATQLFGYLNDYGAPLMPSSQRLFLMQRLQSQWSQCPPFRTRAAEELAAVYLESHPEPLTTGQLQSTTLPDVWAFQTSDKRRVALFRLDRLQSEMEAVIRSQTPIPEIRLTVLSPADSPSGIDPFLRAYLSAGLSSWQLVLSLEGSDPFAAVTRQRNTVYLWIGALVIVVLALMALFVAAYIRRQMRLARLKNDLIATVSHEIKTPLASMRLLVDTLVAGHYKEQQQVLDYLQLIGRENVRLSNLIDNFLAFSRMERNKATFEKSTLRAEEIVNAALDVLSARLHEPGCQVETDLAPSLPAISGDREALVTVLVNLLDNALKYSGSNKRIRVRSYASNSGVCIEVGDNGIGLSRRAAKKVFERFYQADNSLSRRAGGCGLGLSIVKFIVTQHGGSVGVKSEPGKGSTFTVQLPAAAEGAVS